MKKMHRYAAIGYVVSKFGLPFARREAKRAARRKASGAVHGTAGAMKRNPARTSVATGALIGAVGWLVMRGRRDSDSE